MRQTMKDSRILWYRVLLRKLLTTRHFAESLSAKNPCRNVPPTRQDMLRASAVIKKKKSKISISKEVYPRCEKNTIGNIDINV